MMYGKRTAEQQRQLWLSARTAMCGLGVWASEFRAYWNFIQQADKVKRNRMADYGPGGLVLVPLEVKEQAWRALVERYVRQGLERKTLVALLYRLLTVRLA